MVETGPPVQNSGDVNIGNRELKIDDDDGYKWKKYTHKEVSSGHKRIHYKCQFPLCLIKKKVETSSDGYITRITYHGEHNHTKPRSTIRSPSSSASDQQLNVFQGPSSGSGQVVTQENPIRIESEQNYVNDIISIQIESDIDILDDGYKWKKYCTKYVKGNPNPRIYFRCTTPDCPVKKRVERAPNDIKSVITTYERKHNHPVPVAGSGQDRGRSSSQPAN
ncbi:putative transcription factor WRKY family [Helianthus annuus]|uniref:Putative WRKY domain-containing protein n=1 Tax=Helianthus annuus TaxID=4232 RepID=A0A251VP84_HELAN|nr:putative transcription factor WRKY family [Helianthus annuus]KAJ0626669.1 putative transcription factor WRKY family [Helianthus annuus]KAJ0956653.1 putative transcription factor WRKY family [Helianthus annuus]